MDENIQIRSMIFNRAKRKRTHMKIEECDKMLSILYAYAETLDGR